MPRSFPLHPSHTLCLIENLRHSDAINGIIAGEFLLKNQRDFVVAKNDTLEFYRFDPANLSFQPFASYSLFGHIYCISCYNLKSPNANIFDDLQEEFDDFRFTYNMNHLKSKLRDTSVPLLERYMWQGSDLILITSSRRFLDVFAVVFHPIKKEPVFLHLNEIVILKKRYCNDYCELGTHLAIHPTSRDIAIGAYRSMVQVWSSLSPTAYFPDPEHMSPPPSTSLPLTMMLIWHLFYLQPHPLLNTNYLVVIGYRDLTKQAVITLFEKTDTDTSTYCLPFDLVSHPSISFAFPLPFSFDTFCIVTELYLIVCKVPDIMNGNTSLKRMTFPDTADKISGYCTIPDCITEMFYLISEGGVLYEASLEHPPTKLQSTSIRDGRLIYIRKETIGPNRVDVLLAYSDRSDWLLLLVGPKFFHSVVVHECISPISCAATLNSPSSLILAGNNRLIRVEDKKPFYIQSKSSQEFSDVVALFAHENLLLVSFGFYSRLFQLSDEVLRDLTQATEILADASTIFFFEMNNKYYQINAQKIHIVDEAFKKFLWWDVPEFCSITHAARSPRGLYVILSSPSGSFLISQFSFELNLLQQSAPFLYSPTCLACSSAHIYVGTYDASVLVFSLDLTVSLTLSLPDLHVPNSLLVLPNDDLWVGCRNGYYHHASTSVAVGFGPVHLFRIGGKLFFLCDDQLYEYREAGLVSIALTCQHIVPFTDGVLCVKDAQLVLGRIGSGLSITKIDNFPKPPRRVLVTDMCNIVICTSQHSSDIFVTDHAFDIKTSLSFKHMVVSILEWKLGFRNPKIIFGTAIFQDGKESGGQYHVYSFIKHSTFGPGPDPWSSERFPNPVRAIAPFGKFSFVISSGNKLLHQRLDKSSNRIVTQATFCLPSTVTCFALNEDHEVLAVGTLKDSVNLVRFADPHWKTVAVEGHSRYVVDMAWAKTQLIACDQQGTVFASLYRPDLKSGVFQTLFRFQLGCSLVGCLPLRPHEFLCVSVSGAFFLIRTIMEKEIFKPHLDPHCYSNLNYLFYRQVPWAPAHVTFFSLVELEKMAQDPLLETDIFQKFSRKL